MAFLRGEEGSGQLGVLGRASRRNARQSGTLRRPWESSTTRAAPSGPVPRGSHIPSVSAAWRARIRAPGASARDSPRRDSRPRTRRASSPPRAAPHSHLPALLLLLLRASPRASSLRPERSAHSPRRSSERPGRPRARAQRCWTGGSGAARRARHGRRRRCRRGRGGARRRACTQTSCCSV